MRQSDISWLARLENGCIDVLIGPQIEAVQGFPALVQAHCINRSLFKFDEYKFLFIYF